ncbi:hypothetical protein L226DRAFT_540183 [Lentinus tigrinus ALCF2SS1-7]|uniref:Uncharacterized protein n=1 Tax=Lentinus tigrinus ALCF2SS1-6 TaxID=1328759 RepID=A0A5C2S311_9APHY|nr:hypothetical protein L227DRAFT_577542 [Lentinus tigrinus ALCF2SS1-6]RPD69018.1 hypothetical protein L226DRAFT_540183 [Lentinus tigrinus ALCF2SS1-7]
MDCVEAAQAFGMPWGYEERVEIRRMTGPGPERLYVGCMVLDTLAFTSHLQTSLSPPAVPTQPPCMR